MTRKLAIVSGASRGLGREIAIALAADQYTTVVTYAGNPAKAQEVIDQIESAGGQAMALKADVSSAQEVQALFDTVKQRFGRIDVVINTAAVSVLKALQDFSTDEMSKVFATNIEGTFHVLQQAAKHIEKGGRILTFSSNVVGSLPAHYAVYAASKAAVESMSKVLSKELRGKEVTVNIISPGPTGTEMFLEGKSPEVVAQFAQQSPFGRLGTPDDIIRVIRFLVGPESTWINGQVIKINGGAN